MEKFEFLSLLKIAEQNENVKTKLMHYLTSASYELSEVYGDLIQYMDEELEDFWKWDIQSRYDGYFDVEDEYEISDILEECEFYSDYFESISDSLENNCFSFEDWGNIESLEWGKGDLDIDYDSSTNSIIISLPFLTRLLWYIEDVMEMKTFNISVDELLLTNNSDVA
ncbi:hypothetical protein [uncultured Duncaniella sp.]|uniref:hypothetical protein n=1 Tax=uncultured Duncaniella sp. TaxID=2768039 RepID=UPI0026209F77|nr:hypothetical protein [uncultured Duncaniella sp.]